MSGNTGCGCSEDPCGCSTYEEPCIALVDFYMPVGTTGIQFVAALEAVMRSWGPVFALPATKAAYRRAGSSLAHMALVDGQTFRFMRVAAEMTPLDAAAFLDVPVGTILAWEDDVEPIPTEQWYRMGERICQLDGRQFTPYLTLPTVDLRPRIIRVRPDVPREGVPYSNPLCPCPC